MVDVHDDVDPGSKNCDRAVRLAKDPAKRQEGKEALRAVDKEVRNLQDEARRCELNLNSSHAGVWLWHCFGCVCVCVCVCVLGLWWCGAHLVLRNTHSLAHSLTHSLTWHVAVTIDARATDGDYKKEIDRIQAGTKESYARQLKTLDRTLDVRMFGRACVHACMHVMMPRGPADRRAPKPNPSHPFLGSLKNAGCPRDTGQRAAAGGAGAGHRGGDGAHRGELGGGGLSRQVRFGVYLCGLCSLVGGGRWCSWLHALLPWFGPSPSRRLARSPIRLSWTHTPHHWCAGGSRGRCRRTASSRCWSGATWPCSSRCSRSSSSTAASSGTPLASEEEE